MYICIYIWQVLLDSKLLLETVEKGGVRHLGTHSLSLLINICIALRVRKMLQKDSKDKIFALEELRASKQLVTWEGDKYSLKHLLIAHQ